MKTCSYIDMNNKNALIEASYILKALANETRLCVILQLSEGQEKSVSEILHSIQCEQSLLSHHLTDMRAKGILNCRKSGKNCFYSLKNPHITQIVECVLGCSNEVLNQKR